MSAYVKSLYYNILFKFLLSLSFIFIYFYDVPLSQHSFPTRRSSDLTGTLRGCTGRRCGACSCKTRPACGTSRSPRCRPSRARSEEHTSELQSRRELVCRLLLEKKKYMIDIIRTKRIILSVPSYSI